MNIKKLFTVMLVSAIFIFLLSNIYKNWQIIIDYNWRFNPQNIILLLVFLVPVYLVNGLSWYLVNKSLGTEISYLKSLKVLMLGNFARFIPGGIWQYAGKIYFAKKEGVDSSKTSLAILTETLFTLISGVMIIFIIGIFWKLPVQEGNFALIIFMSALLTAVILLFGNKKFVDLLSRLLQKLGGKKKIIPLNLSVNWIPILLISYSLQFFVDGTVLYFLSQNATNISLELYPLFIAIFAIAWLAGFITIFAPSGLGVQEVTLAALLSGYMPFAVASLIAIVFRLLLLISEILLISIIFIKDRKFKNI